MSEFLSKVQKVDIKLSSQTLAIGETTRAIACPICHDATSFAVTRQPMGLFYICFRATCGLRGFIPNIFNDWAKPKKPKTKFFRYDTRTLKRSELNFFWEEYEVGTKELQTNAVVFCQELGRVVFPCFTQEGWIWGYNARYYRELAPENHPVKSKSILYVESETVPRVSWARGRFSDSDGPLVLVEDHMSAIKLSLDVEAIALLGTNIPEDLWPLISKRNVILALDNDATKKSISAVQQAAMKVKSIRCLALRKDIKNQTDKEYQATLTRIFSQ